MASEGGGRQVLKWGCLGCLGCLGVIVLLGLILFGVGWMSARGQRFEEEVRTHEPVASPAPMLPAEAPTTTPSSSPGKVTLEVGQGEIQVRPGRPGEFVRVEASYSKTSHELTERFEQPEVGPWTYQLTFRGRGGGLMSMLRHLFSGQQPRVTVYLPPDAPLALDLEIRQGGAQIDLGGLWLDSAEIDIGQGGAELEVSRPLHGPMERLVLRSSMGGMAVRRLGNASPATLSVENRMGGMDLDLRGEWTRDARISLQNSMGGMSVSLPRDVRLVGVEGQRARLGVTEAEVEGPTLTFEVSPSESGEIEFR